MGRLLETKINTFNGGMVSEPRLKDYRHALMVKNFDVFTYPHKLVPFRDSENGDSASTTSKKENFVVALRTGTTYSIYALGVKSGASTAEVLYKDVSTGGTNDLGDNGWVAPSANQSASGAVNKALFVFYKKTGKIYGASGTQYLWSFDPGGGAWSDTEVDLTSYTTVAQGLVHSKDDILYVPYDNKVAKNNNGSWTAAALTLPNDKVITSICEWGNYLAIAARSTDSRGKSIVYLWDRDSTLSTLAESIEWGEGNLRILDNVDGYLVGISEINDTFTSTVVVRAWAGGQSTTLLEQFIFEEQAFAGGSLNSISKQKLDNRLYFIMQLHLGGVKEAGIWEIGRKEGRFIINLFRTVTNDTTLPDNARAYGFLIYGSYILIAYTSDSGNSTYAVSKTNDQSSYTATSIYETLVINESDSDFVKKLIGVTAVFEALPSAGQVVVKYKKDEETTFTTIFTYSTDNGISHGSVNIESSGATLPEYKEIQFRIESTGGAEITGLKWKSEIISKELY